MFIRNCWYAAAWPHEVTDKPLARTLLGEPVVLYRQADGRAVAGRRQAGIESDAGGVQARRVMAERLAAETAKAAEPETNTDALVVEHA